MPLALRFPTAGAHRAVDVAVRALAPVALLPGLGFQRAFHFDRHGRSACCWYYLHLALSNILQVLAESNRVTGRDVADIGILAAAFTPAA